MRPRGRLVLVASLLAAGGALGCAARRAPVVVDAGIVPVEQPAGVETSPVAVSAPSTATEPTAASPIEPAIPSSSEATATESTSAIEPPREPVTATDASTTAAQSPDAASTVTPPAVPGAAPASTPAPASEAVPTAAARPQQQKTSLHELCHQDPASDGFINESRRLLAETFCGATLWFDGLFGGTPDVRNARATSGRVELSGLHTDFHGFDERIRLRVNYDLPNMERRVRLMLGRDDPEVIKTDRQEGFAIRSSVFGLEDRDEWLAGLGYRPPGRYLQRVDFGVGARVKTSPEVYAQARYRRNFFLGSNDVWRFRETIFWENRDGYGSTTSLDWDRVLRRDLLVRWGNVGTVSEATQGLEWRSALVLYHNLRDWRAIAGESFWRGATDAEVKLREFGVRGIYRHPLHRHGMQAPHLFGDVIVGYTWPREEPHQKREGSLMVGIGFELLFGQQPY